MCSSSSVAVEGRRVGPDEGVRVAVADELQVDVIAQPSPGAHGVQLLPRLGTGQQAVHGVGGDPLCGVNRGGITESHGSSYVAGRQVDGAALRRCLTRVPSQSTLDTVQRSPFFTQSVAEVRSWRSLRRVMISSPALARFPSARPTSGPGAGADASRWARARRLSSATRSRVGASMIESSPRLRSARHASNRFSVSAVRSPTWIRCRSR